MEIDEYLTGRLVAERLNEAGSLPPEPPCSEARARRGSRGRAPGRRAGNAARRHEDGYC